MARGNKESVTRAVRLMNLADEILTAEKFIKIIKVRIHISIHHVHVRFIPLFLASIWKILHANALAFQEFLTRRRADLLKLI